MDTTRFPGAWRSGLRVGLALLALGGAALPAARADFELTDAQGRRILLKDDGTWRFADAKAAKEGPLVELSLTRRIEAPGSCTFELTMTNLLPYEIRSMVPDFTVMRANGVAYRTHNIGFGVIRPGDQRQRQLRFDGIACADIATLKVSGGDRCEMGELHKFSDANGECLSRVRVLPSQLLKFEK